MQEQSQIRINELNSEIHALDSDSLLTPQTMGKIVQAVLVALREQEAHSQRIRAEQRISRSVRDELDEGWG